MLDLDRLHSFVSGEAAGGFTTAGERVHRSQSTLSQQIRTRAAAREPARQLAMDIRDFCEKEMTRLAA